jgi:hypothetical protein
MSTIPFPEADPLRGAAPGPAPQDAPNTGLRGWIVKVTGVLLVVPALLNAGYDIYATALELPRNDAERANEQLFRKYFNKPPLAVMPVPVRTAVGTTDVRFSIYEEGEVYVEFGGRSQWFPFPRAERPDRLSWLPLGAAHAQGASPPVVRRPSIASQQDVIRGSELTRSTVYADGTTERRKIDIRTGTTLQLDKGRVAADHIPSLRAAPRVMRVDPVDIRSLQESAAGG